VLAALLTALVAASPCTGQDADDGETFDTCFDPGNGIELGTGALLRVGQSGTRFGASANGAILIRTERSSMSKEGTLWFNEHRFLTTRAQADSLLVSAYQANFRRHLKEGFLLVPTTPPIRLPFPFDVSINVSALRYERRVFEGAGYSLETGRAAILLDPIRSPTGSIRLAIGPSLSHGLRVREGNELQQEFSPLTSLYGEFVAETDDGWWNVRANALAGYVFTIDGSSFLRVRSEAMVERLLFAVNDQPVAVRLSGTYVRADAGVLHRSEWTAGVSLVMRLLSPNPRKYE
jgi:hypothetical protein